MDRMMTKQMISLLVDVFLISNRRTVAGDRCIPVIRHTVDPVSANRVILKCSIPFQQTSINQVKAKMSRVTSKIQITRAAIQ